MGTDVDGETRELKRREDDQEKRRKIQKARKIILKDCYGVNSSGVEAQLKPTLLGSGASM